MRTKNRLQRLIQVRELPLLAFIVLLIIFFSITIKGFMTVQNFAMISRQITTVGIVSIGMTLVLVTGGIDLSVGAISFAINIGGLLIIRGLPIAITYPFILLLGQ